MQRPDLYNELRDACARVSPLHLRRLNALGVSLTTVAELGREHCGLGIIRGTEHPSEPGHYILDPEGPPMLVLPVFEAGDLVDLVAFRATDANRWLLRTGLGWCLGLERGLDAHTWLIGDEAVALTVSPLEWLQGGGRGLCILDWAAPELRSLAGIPRVLCSTEQQAQMLRAALARPVPNPTIIIKEARRAAA